MSLSSSASASGAWVQRAVRVCVVCLCVQVIENAVFAFKQPPTLMRHIAVTCVIVTLTVLTSLLTDCVGIVLELNVSSRGIRTMRALARFTRSNSTTSGKPKFRKWVVLGRPFAVCYGTAVCPVCLSVTLVYCDQTAGWIKMPLAMEVGLGPGDIVLDGDQSPQKWGHSSPQFSAHVCCGQTVAHLNNC